MLALKIPPPIVFLFCGLLAWAAGRYLPQYSFTLPSVLPTLVLVVAGVLIEGIAFMQFRRARTTINPLAPARTEHLVTTGIYRLSRNPMYVGLLLILTGAVLIIENAAALLCLPLFVLYITRFQIMPEERILRQKFPTEFADYTRCVRRFI